MDCPVERVEINGISIPKHGGDMLNYIKKAAVPVLLAGIWINLSEFARNELLLKSHWVRHYQQLGMVFPSEPLNNAVWAIWGFLFAAAVFIVSRKFNLIQTTLLCWFFAFVMMWIVTWNMCVLPGGILYFAVPLSLFETFIGACICKKMSP
jgi:hypothetical protein